MYQNYCTFLFLFVFAAYNQIVVNAQSTRKYPTVGQVDFAHRVIVNMIENNKEKIGGMYAFPYRAGFVRLAFHDCTGTNGCDGCVDHSLKGNKGLARYSVQLDDEYDNNYSINSVMSKADFYILAGYVALEEASKHHTSPRERIKRTDNFKAGRLTCISRPPEPFPKFPSGEDELSDTSSFFSTHFPSFTSEDKVAILGAHTLGECRESNFGFEGKWVNGVTGKMFKSDLLDNDYYKKVNGYRWTQVAVESSLGPKKQWQRFGTKPNDEKNDSRRQAHMVLNIDMSLQFNLKTNGPIGTDGGVSCSILVYRGLCISEANDCCQRATTNIRKSPDNFFKKFRKDNIAWIAAFKRAYNKMTETRLPSDSLQFPIK